MQGNLLSVLIVAVLALIAPLLTVRLRRLRIPVAAMEVLLGIVFGQAGLRLLQPTPVLQFLSLFGLSYLMFLSGLEIDVVRFMKPTPQERRGLVTAGVTALVLLVAGITGGLEMGHLGLVKNGLAVGLLLGSAAPTVILPTLKEGRRVGTAFGRTVLSASLLLDIVGLIGVSLLAGLHSTGLKALLALFLLVPLVGAIRMSGTLRRWWVGQGWDSVTGQIGVRGSLAIVVVFIALADSLGTAAVLGAFAAGMTAAVVLGNHLGAIQERLDAIGYGYFVPFFFLLLGAQVSFSGNPSRIIGLVGIALGAFVVLGLLASLVLGIGLRDMKRGLGGGALLATHLSVTVAGTAILDAAHVISPTLAVVIILASVLSAVIFPSVSLWLVPPRVDKGRAVLLVGAPDRTRRLEERLRGQGEMVTVARRVEKGLPAGDFGVAVVLGDGEEENTAAASVLSEAGLDRIIVEVHPEGADQARQMGWVPFVPEMAATELLDVLVLAPAGADLLAGRHEGEIIDIRIGTSEVDGLALKDADLPPGVLVVSLERGRDHLVPRGQTILRLGDVLTFLAPSAQIDVLRSRFGRQNEVM